MSHLGCTVPSRPAGVNRLATSSKYGLLGWPRNGRRGPLRPLPFSACFGSHAVPIGDSGELCVAFGQAPHEHRPIRRLDWCDLEQPFQAVELEDEKRVPYLLEPARSAGDVSQLVVRRGQLCTGRSGFAPNGTNDGPGAPVDAAFNAGACARRTGCPGCRAQTHEADDR